MYAPLSERPQFVDLDLWPVLERLTDLLQLSSAFCSNVSKMDKVSEALRITKEKFEALYGWLAGVLDDQRLLCQEEIQREVDNYKLKKTNDLSLIKDLHVCYRTTTDYPARSLGTRMIAKLLEIRLPKDETKIERVTEEAGKLADEALKTC